MIPPRPALLEMQPYRRPDAARAHGLRLDLNENLWGCSPRVRSVLADFSTERISMYPDPRPLAEMIARRLDVPVEWVRIANGGDDAIDVVFRTFVSAGDRVAFCVPTYTIYPLLARAVGARTVTVPYGEAFAFPVDAGWSQVPPPRLLVLAHPNNPTGTLVPRTWLQETLERWPHTIVLMDEAYADFLGETWTPWIHRYPNLVVVRTFSKLYGLAGLRVGYLIARPELQREMQKIHHPYAVNAVAIAAACAALMDTAFVERVLHDLEEVRQRVVRAVREMGLEIVAPATNFVLIRVGPHARTVIERLRAHAIWVRDVTPYPGLTEYIRVTLAPWNRMERFIRTFAQVMKT